MRPLPAEPLLDREARVQRRLMRLLLLLLLLLLHELSRGVLLKRGAGDNKGRSGRAHRD